MPSVAANAQLRTTSKMWSPSRDFYLPRDRAPRSGEPPSPERNKTSGHHTCDSLLPYRTIHNLDPKQSHPDQLINVETKLLSSQHSPSPVSIRGVLVLPVPFRFRLSRCSSVPSNSGNRLVPTQKKTQDCTAQRFGQVRREIEAGSVCQQ